MSLFKTRAEYQRHWRKSNPESWKRSSDKYRLTNKSKVSQNTMRWQKTDRGKAYRRKWFALNKERVKILAKSSLRRHPKTRLIWAEKNRERNRMVAREHYNKNREKIRFRCNRYRRVRNKKDVNYALLLRLRTRTNAFLKGRKSFSTMQLVGCSLDELKSHLKSLFKPGMSWNNRSEWHIDHKLPCASFDLTEPEQQKRCFHYTNLQPLWWWENLAKSDKIAA